MSLLMLRWLPIIFLVSGAGLFLVDAHLWKKHLTSVQCRARRSRLSLLTFTSLIGACSALFTGLLLEFSQSETIAENYFLKGFQLSWNGLSLAFAFGLTLLIALAALVLGTVRAAEREGAVSQLALLLLAASGALITIDASGLIQLYIGIETLSIATLALIITGAPRRNLSEAGMKFFLFSSLGSALLLFGGALLFGATKQVLFSELQLSISAMPSDSSNSALLLLGVLLSVCGLLIKAGIAPFHFAFIDAFYGTSFAGRISLGLILRGSATFALFKLQLIAFSDPRLAGWGVSLSALLALSAFISVTIGTLVAARQIAFPRILAWACLLENGLVLAGLVAVASLPQAVVWLLFSWFVGLASFLGLLFLHEYVSDSLKSEASTLLKPLMQWQGLIKNSPTAVVLFLFFFGTAASLPLTAGFLPKLVLAQAQLAALRENFLLLSLGGSFCFVIAYSRVIRAALCTTTGSEKIHEKSQGQKLIFAVLLCLALCLLSLSIWPQVLTGLGV